MSKAAKHRSCPIAGREITSAECGQNRNTRFACPDDCAFNPFARSNYTQLLETEKKVDDAFSTWMLQTAPNRGEMSLQLEILYKKKALAQIHAFFVFHLFFLRDQQGKSAAERFKDSGFLGLKNDEILLFQLKMGMKPRLFEIHAVLDNERCQVSDLTKPGTADEIILDRGLATKATRFASFLAWAFPMPQFTRLSGTIAMLPSVTGFEPAEMIQELVTHLGGPKDPEGMLLWICQHFATFETAIEAIMAARRRKMLTTSDLNTGRAIYDLCRPFRECREKLDSIERVELDSLDDRELDEGFSDARVWFETEQEDPVVGGRKVALGRVLLGQTMWRLETLGAARLATIRNLFETALQGKVQFKGERLDNIGEIFAAQDGPSDSSLVSPRFVETANTVRFSTSRVAIGSQPDGTVETEATIMARIEREFLHHSVPALDNKTPVEAAANPELRPKLIRLMKDRVQSVDERNLDSGGTHDIDWMLRELGLNEMLFPPPPARPIPESSRRGNKPGEPEPLDLPPAPRLPRKPLTIEQIEARASAAHKVFSEESEALSAMEHSGGTIIDDLGKAGKGLLPEEDFDCFVPVLLDVWFAFVPVGTRGPSTQAGSLEERVEVVVEQLMKSKESATFFRSMVEQSPQPVLLEWAFSLLHAVLDDLPETEQPSTASWVIMNLMLKVVIDELHEALA